MAIIWAILLFLLNLAPVVADEFGDALSRGEGYLAQGLYHQALEYLEQVQALPRSTTDDQRLAGALGEVYFQLHDVTRAEDFLLRASQTPSPRQAHYLNLLGNLYLGQRRYQDAEQHYRRALASVQDQPLQRLAVELNLSRLLPEQQRLEALQRLLSQLEVLDGAEDKARLALNLGEQARPLGASGLALSYRGFEMAHRLTQTGSSPRLASEALGALGYLYEQQQRHEEALELTLSALHRLQSQMAHDLAFQWEWQLARLYRRLGQPSSVLAAFQRAVTHIEAIRQDIPVTYQDGRSSFRSTLEPIYLGLADTLLQQARSTEDEQERQRLLRQARDSVELLKQTELDDFLGSRCLIQSRRHDAVESLPSGTAILYPIVLPDRLELLLGVEQRWYSMTVAIKAKEMQRNVLLLAYALRKQQHSYHDLARRLYEALIAPWQTRPEAQAIKTLVIVPDGVLRLINVASLYDGQHFVLERYAVATVPALTLLDMDTPASHGYRALVAGLSRPGSVVDKLNIDALSALLGEEPEGMAASAGPSKPSTRSLMGGLRGLAHASEGDLRQVQLTHLLSLPGVKEEVLQVSQQGRSTVLLDEAFTLQGFKQNLVQNDYRSVHIASHGFFSSNAEQSFLMTYDELLHLDQLESLLGLEKFRETPLALITLSACQTAEGDDRAPLGIGGMALKARARSVLGTLWPISDRAAQVLMAHFYQNWLHGSFSKAEALRQAQLRLLQDPELSHPFFWSPFLLMGNWS